jgi:methyl-accepting chemotaxis protein
MKNIKLGIKIGGGFGILILIACALGGLAVFNMKSVETDSTRLAKEYVPEVDMANQLEGSIAATMFAIRGYSFTEETSFLEDGKKQLTAALRQLDTAKKHAETYPELTALRENVQRAKEQVDSYVKLLDQSESSINAMNADRAGLNKQATEFISNAGAFTASMSEAMKKEIAEGAEPEKLSERVMKIQTINQIVDLGNDCRIKAWQAQALRKLSILDEAMQNFSTMDALFAQLVATVRNPVNIKQLEVTRKAATDYRQGMLSLQKNWLALEAVNVERNKAGGLALEAAQKTSHHRPGAEGRGIRQASCPRAT